MTSTAAAPASMSAAEHPMIRIGAYAALAAGTILIAKVVLIIASGNRVSATLTGGLYVVGMILPLVAAAGIAARGATTWLGRAGIALLVVFGYGIYVTMLSDAVEVIAHPFSDAAHVRDEVPIAVIGVIWLLVGRWLRRAED